MSFVAPRNELRSRPTETVIMTTSRGYDHAHGASFFVYHIDHEMSVNSQERESEEWLRRYLHEYITLEEAAALAGGITREGIRQRLKARGFTPRGTAETLRLRELRTVSAKASTLREAFFRTRSVTETAAVSGVSSVAVRRFLDREIPDWVVLTRLARDARKIFSTGEMIASLRKASTNDDLPLTTTDYRAFVTENPTFNDGRPRPGVQAMILRFGSWNGAVNAAGLPANPHGGPSKEFGATDAINAVVECWRETGKPPSAAAYDSWQVGRDGRPSGATVRKLFESWPSIQVRAWQIVHGIILDQDDEDVAIPVTNRDSAARDTVTFLDYKRANEGAVITLPDAYEVGEYNALERAVRSHSRIQNAAAAVGETLGLVPHSPGPDGPAFDLAMTRSDGVVFVIVVKSATSENIELQMRLGLGQLLFYAHRLTECHTRVSPILLVEIAPDSRWRSLLASVGVGLVIEPTMEDDLHRLVSETGRRDASIITV